MTAENNFKYNLRLIVNETYNLKSDDDRIEQTASLIQTVYLETNTSGILTFKFNGKELDIPTNWGLFNEYKVHEGICNLAERDYMLYKILCSYFEISADIFLGFDFEKKAYFIISQKKEKAA